MSLALLALLALLGGCTPVGPKSTDYVSTTGPEHCGSIEADEVWAADLNPHVITCHVDIDAGTLTIGPGTEILVDDIKHLSVNGEAAGLLALGTAEEPIRIAGSAGTVGSWNGLSFWDGALGELHHVELLGGGYVAVPTVPYVSLTVSNTEILVEDLRISDGLDYGFALTELGTFAAGSSGLVSTGNGRPGYGDADVVGTIVMEGLDLTGNTDDVVVIAGGHIEGDAEWLDPGVPYEEGNSSTRVDGTDDAPASLRIGPGVEIRFDAGAGLSAGGYGPASIVLDGTADAPIKLTSLTEDPDTYWEGLRLGDAVIDASTRLTNVEISYGGDGYYNYGNIHLENASPTIQDAFLHDSMRYGIYCEGECAPTLEGVTYADNPDGDVSW